MRDEVLEKLKAPAIGLIITGSINIILGIIVILSALFGTASGSLNRGFSGNEEKIGYFIGFFGPSLIGVLSVIFAPLIIFGGIRMLKGKSRNLAICAAILATIPLSSCCFIAGSIFGIWALVILIKPDVKAFFQSST
jgi:hypothetical protein